MRRSGVEGFDGDDVVGVYGSGAERGEEGGIGEDVSGEREDGRGAGTDDCDGNFDDTFWQRGSVKLRLWRAE